MRRATSELRKEAGEAARPLFFIVGFCAVPVLALATVFWAMGGSGPAIVVLALGLPIPALVALMFTWGLAHERCVRRVTSIELDEASGIIRFRGFRERVQGRVSGRVPERAVSARTVRAIRRTTHGPNWETTVVWVDENGDERQVLVDNDALQPQRFSESLAFRLGLTVETRND